MRLCGHGASCPIHLLLIFSHLLGVSPIRGFTAAFDVPDSPKGTYLSFGKSNRTRLTREPDADSTASRATQAFLGMLEEVGAFCLASSTVARTSPSPSRTRSLFPLYVVGRIGSVMDLSQVNACGTTLVTSCMLPAWCPSKMSMTCHMRPRKAPRVNSRLSGTAQSLQAGDYSTVTVSPGRNGLPYLRTTSGEVLARAFSLQPKRCTTWLGAHSNSSIEPLIHPFFPNIYPLLSVLCKPSSPDPRFLTIANI